MTTHNSEAYIGHSKVTEEVFAKRTADVEAAFFVPYLRPDMDLVDCGCGQGTITAGLAEVVSPGRVVGFDTLEAHLEKGRQLASERGLTNVSFETGDINEPSLPPESFDAAFIHIVLCYLTDPLGALRRVRRLLRPGGVIGVVDIGNPAMLSGPNGHHMVALVELYQALVQKNCPNPYVETTPYIGLSLKQLLQEAGFSRVEMSARVSSNDMAQAARSMRNFRDTPHYGQIIEQGLATRAELEEHLQGATAWVEDPDAWGFRLWPCAVAFND